MKTCPECAEEVQLAANVCRYCGFRFDGGAGPAASVPRPQAPASAGPRSRKSAGGATVLGLLLAGLGHFYVGEVGRGAILLGSVAAGAVASGIAGVGYLALLVVYIVSAVDAYRAADNFNTTGRLRAVSGRYWAILALAVLSLAVALNTDSGESLAGGDACIVTAEGEEVCGESARGWCDTFADESDAITAEACDAVRR